MKIAPTVITLHRLTTDQLESLAITNGLTAISLGFLGMAFGALVSYQTALATSYFRDEIGRVAFESYKTSAITLTAFFAVVFIGSLIFSVRKLWRVRVEKTTTPPETPSEPPPTKQPPE